MTTALIGLGNILLKDEGVGVHAVNTIGERYDFSPEIEIIDGGTLGLDLLHFFEGKEKILIIDAVDFRKEPGYVGILEGDAIPSSLFSKLSVHHIGLSDLLFAAKLKDLTPSKLCLIGVQPQSLELGLEMTDTIRDKMKDVIAMTIQKLKEWNIACVSRSPQKLSV
ncbi:MAG TPA: HyaD/HybD family hydrogenase maturation endopeptidase [Thermodesulfovibrionales bacterium]|nr:HyaD/HybD family hydrogenase maturation endopeptidase [Thermodesulfovibrionales bacterium]